jgi:hypothetical protein
MSSEVEINTGKSEAHLVCGGAPDSVLLVVCAQGFEFEEPKSNLNLWLK